MTPQEEQEIIAIREKWFRDHFSSLQREIQYNICKTSGPMKDYSDDLTQIAVMQFLNKPLEVQKQMLQDSKVENYILVTAGMHIRSSTSPFYNIVRKHKMQSRSGALPDVSNEDDLEWLEDQEWYQCYKREMEKMNFYFRQLLIDKYEQGLSYDDLHKKYNITKTSLNKDVHAALQFLRCRCSNICK
jgi:hypothetical protein